MASGSVSKDSWSSCEASSTFYDTLRNPNSLLKPKPSVAAAVKRKDTIESIEQRLQREMAGKLHHKGLELPHETYVAVVQVGKYLFLSIMLPVYLCCYGIPHWFLVQALPIFFSAIKKQSLNLGRFVVKIGKQTADLMKSILDQLLGNALRMSRDKANDLLKCFFSKFDQMSREMAYFFNKKSLLLKKLKFRMAVSSGNLYKKFASNGLKVKLSLSEFAFSLTQRMGAASIKAFKKIDCAIFTPFIKMLISPFLQLLRVVNIVKADYEGAFKTLTEWLKKITDPIIFMLNEILKKGKIESKKIDEKIRSRIIVIWRAAQTVLGTYLKKLKKQAINPILHRINLIRDYLKRCAIWIWELIIKVFLTLSASLKNSFGLIWKILPHYLKEKIKERKPGFSRLNELLKNRLKEAAFGCRRMISLSVKLALTMKNLFVRFIEWMKQLLKWFFNQFLATSRKALSMGAVFFKTIAFFTRRIIFIVKVMIVLLWISLIYSFRLAKHLSRPFIS